MTRLADDALLTRTYPRGFVAGLLVHSVLPIAIGGLICLTWRSADLPVFTWVKLFGLHGAVDWLRACGQPLRPHVTDFFVFSAPVGLWAYALVATLRLVWRKADHRHAALWYLVAGTLVVVPEALRSVGVVPGTFDVEDLFAAIVGALGARWMIPQAVARCAGRAIRRVEVSQAARHVASMGVVPVFVLLTGVLASPGSSAGDQRGANSRVEQKTRSVAHAAVGQAGARLESKMR